MSADLKVARKMRLWHVRECHNCVIVPVAAAVVRIINTCGYSRERCVILTSHKMEKTGKHIGREEGRLLLISCLCRETCFIKTPQPAVSLIFTDRPKGHKWREEKPFSFLSFFTTLHWLQTLVVQNKLLKQSFQLFLSSPPFYCVNLLLIQAVEEFWTLLSVLPTIS